MPKDYEELFESIPCGILQLELPFGNTCQIYRANPRAEQIMKAHLKSGTFMRAETYMDEDNLKYTCEILKKLVNPGDQSHFLLKTRNSAIEGDVKLIRMENGHELLQCMFVEIGEEIEARKREARQKEVLERVLNSIDCGVLRFTFEEGEQKITLLNPAAWKLLGFEREEQCLHKTLNDILPQVYPEDRIQVLTTHCSLSQENDSNECEFRVRDKKGGYRRLRALQQYLRSSDGSYLLQVTLTDITLQYQIIEQKKLENEQIIHSLGSVYFAIMQIDVEKGTYRVIKDEIHGNPLKHNGNYSEALQAWNTMRQKIGVADETINLSIDFFHALYKQGKTSWEQDYCQSVGDKKEPRYFRVVLLLSENEGKLDSVTMAIRDITEIHQKELDEKEALRAACEASRQASRAKTDFLSNMSHDIRTPMNAIAGFTQILERHLDSPKILKENIEKIKKSTQILLDLINDVLDVSRIESGKVILDEEPVNLIELTNGIAELIRPSVVKHGHHLVISVHLPDGMFLGDSLRIRQILMNLLSNAVKFTPDGGEIRFSAWEDQNENSRYQNIHFQVQDNGVGMSPEFQKHIFEPFERAPQTENLQGTGLGMTITRNLIHLMNGMIELTSEPGKGSRFHVILPMKSALAQKVKALPEEEQMDSIPDWSQKRILVVEDNELNMEITCTFLEETGVSFEKAINGKMALDMFERSETGYYDLILMDVQMPVMNGYEATRRIRASAHPDGRQIPVIAMTANAFSEDIFEASQAGMNEHLSKPVELSKMYRVLWHWLSKEHTKEEEA